MVCCILRSTGWDWTADLLANTPGNTVLHSLYSQASVGCHTGRSSNYLLAAHGPGNSAAKEKEKISPRYAQSIYHHGSKYKRLDYRLWIFRVNHHERKTNPLFPAALLYGYWVRKKKKKKGNPIVIIAGNRSIPSSHTRDTFYSQLSWPWLTQVAYSVRSAAYRKPTQDEAQPDDLRSTTVRAMHAYTKVCSAHCADRILVSTMGCRFGWRRSIFLIFIF